MMLQKIAGFLFGTLRGRLIVGVATVQAVMMALFIGDLTMRQRALLLDRQAEQAIALSQALATSAAGWVAADDIAGMQELVDAQQRYPELLFAMLTDGQGRVLAATDKARQGLYLLDLPREAHQAVLSRTSDLVDVAVPAVVGGRHVGWARVGVGQKVAGKKLAQITQSGLFYALAAIVAGALIAWQVGLRITRRLYAIQTTINRVRSGNPLARSTLSGSDEAAQMAQEFNGMLDAVAERVMLAELSADVGGALTRQGDLQGLLQESAAALVRHLDAAFARIWTFNVADNVLELQASAGMYTRIDGSHQRVPFGEFKIGMIAKERTPHITNAVIGDPHVHDQQWAQREGMVAFAGHPLIIEDRLVGVMALFSRKPLTDVTIKALAAVSNEIAVGIERKQAEVRLKLLNRELRAISNCNQTLLRALDEQELLNNICRIVCEEAGYRMAWVGYADDYAGKTIRPVAWAGVEEGYLEQAGLTWDDSERGRGPAGVAVRTGTTDCSQDFAIDPRMAPWCESALQRGYRSAIALPLKAHNAVVLGVFLIYSAEANAFTPDEVQLLEELAGDLAFGVTVLRARIEQRQAEELLRQSESRLNEAQRIAHLGNWELDLVSNLLVWSDEIYRIFEIDPEQFGASYDAFLAAIHPDDRDFVNRAYTESVANRIPYNIVHRLQLPDGRIKYVNERCETHYGEDGRPLRSTGTVHDITDRYLAEESLRTLTEELEQRISERTVELETKNRDLERLNRLFVDRELRMVELKERIKELESNSKISGDQNDC
jgi:PAS domain S-box-containing protein